MRSVDTEDGDDGPVMNEVHAVLAHLDQDQLREAVEILSRHCLPINDGRLDFYDDARRARKLLDETIDLSSLEKFPDIRVDRLDARWQKVAWPWIEQIKRDLFEEIEKCLERLEGSQPQLLIKQEEQA